MARYCCTRMERDLTQKCAIHASRAECPDCHIEEIGGGFALLVHDESGALVRINFCPWCGTRLSEIDGVGQEPFQLL